MESSRCAHNGQFHGEVGKEGAVECGRAAVAPRKGGRAGDEDTCRVGDWVAVRDNGVREIKVNSPENGPGTVPAQVAKTAQPIKIRFHSNVVLQEV